MAVAAVRGKLDAEDIIGAFFDVSAVCCPEISSLKTNAYVERLSRDPASIAHKLREYANNKPE